ncbi:glycosyltransferase family 2 protein [Thioalkalivibrio denitrificans]|uniref:glycosyltransferase family 2 protein n=1 Tax=Thioalkalivibrio denitrificans TaxID=108003 RepID=UPI001FE6841E|nr:glycosyltransferase family 2 protein [Thioalkalivibrio denitrificans]
MFRDTNLGCKHAVSGAIDWFFLNEEQGIILEDDCLPHPDFFLLCVELLEHYANDENVSVITGNNFQNGRKRGDASYYFSKYNHCWGWATWRRAWALYEGTIPFWCEWSQSGDWIEKTPDPVERRYWARIFDRVQAGEIDSWAYPWTASVWHKGGLTATPNVNLVSNIGFGPDSTHTASVDSPLAAMATAPLGELVHPDAVAQDIAADRYVFNHTFGGKAQRFPWSVPRRAAGFLYRRLKRSRT